MMHSFPVHSAARLAPLDACARQGVPACQRSLYVSASLRTRTDIFDSREQICVTHQSGIDTMFSRNDAMSAECGGHSHDTHSTRHGLSPHRPRSPLSHDTKPRRRSNQKRKPLKLVNTSDTRAETRDRMSRWQKLTEQRHVFVGVNRHYRLSTKATDKWRTQLLLNERTQPISGLNSLKWLPAARMKSAENA